MKNIYITLGLVATLSLGSCSKFLDIQPVGKVIPTTSDEYRALMTKAYEFPIGDRGLTDLRTDIALSRNQSFDLNLFGDLMRWNDVNFKAGSYSWGWASYYTSIYYANAIIAASEKIEAKNEADKKQLLGEAYMHRAYLHFLLVNLYGKPYTLDGAKDSKAVPLKLDVDLEGLLGRNTVGEVYTQILADIAEAKKHLNKQEWEPALRYRYSALSADALEARVYLYMGQWAEAYAAAERLLASKSTLVNINDADAKLPNQYDSDEMILALEQVFNSSSGRAVRGMKEFVESYSEGDLRRTKYFGDFDEKEQYYQPAKVDGSTKYRCSFRTSELYLISAEAAAHLGKLDQARTRLLSLLKARYTPDAYTALSVSVEALDSKALLSEIALQRAKELALEGHRWFDLRRTTRPALTKVYKDGVVRLEPNDGRYTLPIPREAVEANPALLTE